MTVTVDLSPEIEAKIKTQAANGGVKFEDYVQFLLEEALIRREKLKALSEKSIDEILAPFRREVEESEISDEEFDNLIEEVREEIYREKLAKQSEE